ncbi:unnamed protein product [Knipowitschia caucasica]|uniref:Uncharacterized protein n=1 Tax=Knipowitschia caucasica TaxID=637954 RepID=A0AAV2IUE3_KNICA
MTGEELTEVILKLLVAWREPLWRLQQSLRHHGDLSSQKAVQAGHMVHELRTGVHRVAQQMQTLGRVRNLVTELSSHESPSEGAEWSVLQRSELLHCLRRDSYKVQNYLKILKCRVLPEYGC